MGTDRDWKKWGETDPYFGVYSDDRFRAARISEDDLRDFFASGEAHVDRVFESIRTHLLPGFQPASAVDFGSGVGRLVIPLARRVGTVTGVDVSTAMIREAERNCAQAGVGNVRFVVSSPGLARLDGPHDLIHSQVVFQHIPWRQGRSYLRALAGKVRTGGVLSVHLLVHGVAPKPTRLLARLRYVLPPLQWLWNLAKRRPAFDPPMQMHAYPLSEVVSDLEQAGFGRSYMSLSKTGDGTFIEVMLHAARVPPGDDRGPA